METGCGIDNNWALYWLNGLEDCTDDEKHNLYDHRDDLPALSSFQWWSLRDLLIISVSAFEDLNFFFVNCWKSFLYTYLMAVHNFCGLVLNTNYSDSSGGDGCCTYKVYWKGGGAEREEELATEWKVNNATVFGMWSPGNPPVSAITYVDL